MPAEELGEQPGRLLRWGPLGRVGRHDVGSGQALDERLDPRLGLRQVGRQLGGPGDRPRDRRARSAARTPLATAFQPVAQPEVADDVVAVVALDPIEVGRLRPFALAELEPLLEGDDARPGIAQVDLADEVVERLHLLDRVALDRCPQRLTDDAQEVDHHAFAEEAIDLGLARPVAAHQALEGGRLVRRVVVDVHRRVLVEACR